MTCTTVTADNGAFSKKSRVALRVFVLAKSPPGVPLLGSRVCLGPTALTLGAHLHECSSLTV